MEAFWDAMFKEEKTNWGFEPCDSAFVALDLFKKNNIQNILIPGIGYGRNAFPFQKAGFNVDGIEISETAIQIAKEVGFRGTIHHGSVTQMPFDNTIYDGIFCYALLHLLNKPERKKFLSACFEQLKTGGYMIFTVVSIKARMYENAKLLSKNRYELMEGLKVFFYDQDAIEKEFKPFGLFDYREFDEPIKHIEGEEPLKCFLVMCKK
ncbi:MAG: class I SAM-dependent methyltransferase [Bacteroidales bacterium]|nr:class I SAM-dependent methyltransferase [Bacteroidales bacterium]